MRLTKDSIIPWGCVFKTTYPNGKIYVGSDTARNAKIDFFKYFGSPAKARSEMLLELGDYLINNEPYSLKKNILYSQENVRVGDILKKEQEFIKSLNSKNPTIGYNR
jgi:hypothetical protein